jgi:prepilin-type N-terminal cleavage/methylation domain-containing protein
MSPLRCSKGMSLIEVLIAVSLISIGLLSLMSLQPAAWRSSNRSDYMGRAAMILQQELETNRAWIMNPNNANPCVPTNPRVYPAATVYASGQTTPQPQGDAGYAVQTTITDLAPTEPLEYRKSWRVVVQITWPGNNAGITDSVVVGRQLSFMWPPL